MEVRKYRFPRADSESGFEVRFMPAKIGCQVLAFQTRHLREPSRALEHQSPRKMLGRGMAKRLGTH